MSQYFKTLLLAAAVAALVGAGMVHSTSAVIPLFSQVYPAPAAGHLYVGSARLPAFPQNISVSISSACACFIHFGFAIYYLLNATEFHGADWAYIMNSTVVPRNHQFIVSFWIAQINGTGAAMSVSGTAVIVT